MNKRTTAGIFIGILLVGLLFLIGLSPYKTYDKFDYKLVKVSVKIDAEPANVFGYLGNSNNAKDWSTFVDHITPLNPHEKVDGEIGALRRCFTKNDESEETWDEEILFVEENKCRRLSCYNLQHFKIRADNLQTEQLYEELDDGTTLLSFTFFYSLGKASLIDELKMYLAAFEVASIFEKNLQNIKYFVEKE